MHKETKRGINNLKNKDMEIKTRKMGSEYSYTWRNGTCGGTLITLKVVESDSCNDCFFHHNRCVENRLYNGHCSGNSRTDNKGVIFKKIDVKAYM